MSLQPTFGPASAAMRRLQYGGTTHAEVGTSFPAVMTLLKWWRERMRSRRQLRNLYALDDHILQDIGVTRAAFFWEAEKPFWR